MTGALNGQEISFYRFEKGPRFAENLEIYRPLAA